MFILLIGNREGARHYIYMAFMFEEKEAGFVESLGFALAI